MHFVAIVDFRTVSVPSKLRSPMLRMGATRPTSIRCSTVYEYSMLNERAYTRKWWLRVGRDGITSNIGNYGEPLQRASLWSNNLLNVNSLWGVQSIR